MSLSHSLFTLLGTQYGSLSNTVVFSLQIKQMESCFKEGSLLPVHFQ